MKRDGGTKCNCGANKWHLKVEQLGSADEMWPSGEEDKVYSVLLTCLQCSHSRRVKMSIFMAYAQGLK
ncbi:MAG: hypothetical protein AAB731_02445 [Patescibacteria group bacterium]